MPIRLLIISLALTALVLVGCSSDSLAPVTPEDYIAPPTELTDPPPADTQDEGHLLPGTMINLVDPGSEELVSADF